MNAFDARTDADLLIPKNSPGSCHRDEQDGSILEEIAIPDDPWPSSWPAEFPSTFVLDHDGTAGTPWWHSPDDLSAFLGLELTELPPAAGPSSGRGKRFSSADISILKNWFLAHSKHPYPKAEDIDFLQSQTSLGRMQITTWFANARRRAKPSPARSQRIPSPATRQSIPICRERNNSMLENMDPMTRWRNSPPEFEAADVSDISRAVSRASLGSDSIRGRRSTMDIQTEASRNASLSRSVATSDSNTSASSAQSRNSQLSRHSTDSLRSLGKRRRRRATPRPRERQHLPHNGMPKTINSGSGALVPVVYAFQCTFCTSTFKTRHNWQRHEKTFHLSLESWECSPGGPTTLNGHFEVVCAYCGLPNPNEAHLDSHSYRSCLNRPVAERTFFRRDHLGQHLKLVHQTGYHRGLMEGWKSEPTTIRSRCGFCGLAFGTWAERVEHLAEHFKQGQTMAGWEGDWGFEPDVLDMVENSMPPYLIDFERYSPFPFKARWQPPFGPSSAYELLRLEVEYFCSNYANTNDRPPSNAELQYETCRIILAAELLSCGLPESPSSWLRDLIMSSDSMTNVAKSLPIRSAARSRFTDLQIHGKSSIFQDCSMEAALLESIARTSTISSRIEDDWLQSQAVEIVLSTEAASHNTTGAFADFVIALARKSAGWLAPFRQRAKIGAPSTSPELGQQEDENSPPAPTYLDLQQTSGGGLFENTKTTLTADSLVAVDDSQTGVPLPYIVTERSTVFLDDNNYYRRLIRNLSRYVASATSSRNPNKHMPTDDELQNQARWIMYDDDDPWNQTPADNPQWLRDFKHLVGLDIDSE